MAPAYVQRYGLSMGQTPDGDDFLVFDPAGEVHRLNNTALVILDCCTDPASAAEVAEEVQEAFGLEAPPLAEVEAAIEDLLGLGLVVDAAGVPPAGPVPQTADLLVRASPAVGRGVFARRPFAPGEVIERCPVVVLRAEDVPPVQKTSLGRYTFCWGRDEDQAAVVLGFGSMYNHSDEPNARVHRLEHELVTEFVAVRPIEAGDEILISYGPSVTTHGVTPLPSD